MTLTELKAAANAAATRNYETGSTPDARLIEKLVEAIERLEGEHLDWADYFESFDSTVGAPILTPALAASLMRGPRPWGTMDGGAR